MLFQRRTLGHSGIYSMDYSSSSSCIAITCSDSRRRSLTVPTARYKLYVVHTPRALTRGFHHHVTQRTERQTFSVRQQTSQKKTVGNARACGKQLEQPCCIFLLQVRKCVQCVGGIAGALRNLT